MIIQLCGMSGAGKTTLARATGSVLKQEGYAVEILDGDEYRNTLCHGLGFTKEDRMENIRRMAFVAGQLSKHGIIAILCAINPYEEIRNETRACYEDVKTVFIDCSVDALKLRDTKGLYRRASLPHGHPQKLVNLSGVNDPFEVPALPDLHLHTDAGDFDTCLQRLLNFIKLHYATSFPYAQKSSDHNGHAPLRHFGAVAMAAAPGFTHW